MIAPIDVLPLISQMSHDISRLNLSNPLFIGIHTGGVWIAEKIHQQLLPEGIDTHGSLGALDISFYRDDFMEVGINPEVGGSHLPHSIDDRNIVLIDDVLYSGRTIRAAMNEIFAYGRPATIKLAVLIDRGGKQLPIQADVIGCQLTLDNNQYAKLKNTDSGLQIDIVQSEEDQ
ncbi:MAG: bifunctional pyr operon transcriptional regulator/uracil phosphoribosyltransferase PyrR [Gammaproteobacteria bacterium]|nr:bifunctional pyr operon transcriptional regulator/uracil phosphoribosyltransferase PyrR [Gammaproteobacteria bacterium]